jgi:hypothetical protein
MVYEMMMMTPSGHSPLFRLRSLDGVDRDFSHHLFEKHEPPFLIATVDNLDVYVFLQTVY